MDPEPDPDDVSRELYNMLQAQLDVLKTDKPLEERVVFLMSGWSELRNHCRAFAAEQVFPIMLCFRDQTLSIILCGQWDFLRARYQNKLELIIRRCERELIFVAPKFSHHIAQLLNVLENPWGNVILKSILADPDIVITEIEYEFFRRESPYMILTRLKQLYNDRCEDLALNLVTALMKCCDYASEMPPMRKFIMTVDQTRYTFDVYIALLMKAKRTDEVHRELLELTYEDGYELVKRFTRKRTDLSRLWRSASEVVIIAAATFCGKASTMPYQQIKHSFQEMLQIWLQYCDESGRLQQLHDAWIKLTPGCLTSIHMYAYCDAITPHYEKKMRYFKLKLLVLAISTDINMLERLKVQSTCNTDMAKPTAADPENTSNMVQEPDFRLVTLPQQQILELIKQTTGCICKGFVEMADCVEHSATLMRESLLTAFSVCPSDDLLKRIEDSATALGNYVVPCSTWNCSSHPPQQEESNNQDDEELLVVCPKCGDCSKPLSFEDALKCSANPSIDIYEKVDEENPGIDADIKNDVVVLLFATRHQPLNWNQQWPDLHRLCNLFLRDRVSLKRITKDLDYAKYDYDIRKVFEKKKAVLAQERIERQAAIENRDEAIIQAMLQSDSSDNGDNTDDEDWEAGPSRKKRKRVKPRRLHDSSPEEHATSRALVPAATLMHHKPNVPKELVPLKATENSTKLLRTFRHTKNRATPAQQPENVFPFRDTFNMIMASAFEEEQPSCGSSEVSKNGLIRSLNKSVRRTTTTSSSEEPTLPLIRPRIVTRSMTKKLQEESIELDPCIEVPHDIASYRDIVAYTDFPITARPMLASPEPSSPEREPPAQPTQTFIAAEYTIVQSTWSQTAGFAHNPHTTDDSNADNYGQDISKIQAAYAEYTANGLHASYSQHSTYNLQDAHGHISSLYATHTHATHTHAAHAPIVPGLNEQFGYDMNNLNVLASPCLLHGHHINIANDPRLHSSHAAPGLDEHYLQTPQGANNPCVAHHSDAPAASSGQNHQVGTDPRVAHSDAAAGSSGHYSGQYHQGATDLRVAHRSDAKVSSNGHYSGQGPQRADDPLVAYHSHAAASSSGQNHQVVTEQRVAHHSDATASSSGHYSGHYSVTPQCATDSRVAHRSDAKAGSSGHYSGQGPQRVDDPRLAHQSDAAAGFSGENHQVAADSRIVHHSDATASSSGHYSGQHPQGTTDPRLAHRSEPKAGSSGHYSGQGPQSATDPRVAHRSDAKASSNGHYSGDGPQRADDPRVAHHSDAAAGSSGQNHQVATDPRVAHHSDATTSSSGHYSGQGPQRADDPRVAHHSNAAVDSSGQIHQVATDSRVAHLSDATASSSGHYSGQGPQRADDPRIAHHSDAAAGSSGQNQQVPTDPRVAHRSDAAVISSRHNSGQSSETASDPRVTHRSDASAGSSGHYSGQSYQTASNPRVAYRSNSIAGSNGHYFLHCATDPRVAHRSDATAGSSGQNGQGDSDPRVAHRSDGTAGSSVHYSGQCPQRVDDPRVAYRSDATAGSIGQNGQGARNAGLTHQSGATAGSSGHYSGQYPQRVDDPRVAYRSDATAGSSGQNGQGARDPGLAHQSGATAGSSGHYSEQYPQRVDDPRVAYRSDATAGSSGQNGQGASDTGLAHQSGATAGSRGHYSGQYPRRANDPRVAYRSDATAGSSGQNGQGASDPGLAHQSGATTGSNGHYSRQNPQRATDPRIAHHSDAAASSNGHYFWQGATDPRVAQHHSDVTASSNGQYFWQGATDPRVAHHSGATASSNGHYFWQGTTDPRVAHSSEAKAGSSGQNLQSASDPRVAHRSDATAGSNGPHSGPGSQRSNDPRVAYRSDTTVGSNGPFSRQGSERADDPRVAFLSDATAGPSGQYYGQSLQGVNPRFSYFSDDTAASNGQHSQRADNPRVAYRSDNIAGVNGHYFGQNTQRVNDPRVAHRADATVGSSGPFSVQGPQGDTDTARYGPSPFAPTFSDTSDGYQGGGNASNISSPPDVFTGLGNEYTEFINNEYGRYYRFGLTDPDDRYGQFRNGAETLSPLLSSSPNRSNVVAEPNIAPYDPTIPFCEDEYVSSQMLTHVCAPRQSSSPNPDRWWRIPSHPLSEESRICYNDNRRSYARNYTQTRPSVAAAHVRTDPDVISIHSDSLTNATRDAGHIQVDSDSSDPETASKHAEETLQTAEAEAPQNSEAQAPQTAEAQAPQTVEAEASTGAIKRQTRTRKRLFVEEVSSSEAMNVSKSNDDDEANNADDSVFERLRKRRKMYEHQYKLHNSYMLHVKERVVEWLTNVHPGSPPASPTPTTNNDSDKKDDEEVVVVVKANLPAATSMPAASDKSASVRSRSRASCKATSKKSATSKSSNRRVTSIHSKSPSKRVPTIRSKSQNRSDSNSSTSTRSCHSKSSSCECVAERRGSCNGSGREEVVENNQSGVYKSTNWENDLSMSSDSDKSARSGKSDKLEDIARESNVVDSSTRLGDIATLSTTRKSDTSERNVSDGSGSGKSNSLDDITDRSVSLEEVEKSATTERNVANESVSLVQISDRSVSNNSTSFGENQKLATSSKESGSFVDISDKSTNMVETLGSSTSERIVSDDCLAALSDRSVCDKSTSLEEAEKSTTSEKNISSENAGLVVISDESVCDKSTSLEETEKSATTDQNISYESASLVVISDESICDKSTSMEEAAKSVTSEKNVGDKSTSLEETQKSATSEKNICDESTSLEDILLMSAKSCKSNTSRGRLSCSSWSPIFNTANIPNGNKSNKNNTKDDNNNARNSGKGKPRSDNEKNDDVIYISDEDGDADIYPQMKLFSNHRRDQVMKLLRGVPGMLGPVDDLPRHVSYETAEVPRNLVVQEEQTGHTAVPQIQQELVQDQLMIPSETRRVSALQHSRNQMILQQIYKKYIAQRDQQQRRQAPQSATMISWEAAMLERERQRQVPPSATATSLRANLPETEQVQSRVDDVNFWRMKTRELAAREGMNRPTAETAQPKAPKTDSQTAMMQNSQPPMQPQQSATSAQPQSRQYVYRVPDTRDELIWEIAFIKNRLAHLARQNEQFEGKNRGVRERTQSDQAHMRVLRLKLATVLQQTGTQSETSSSETEAERTESSRKRRKRKRGARSPPGPSRSQQYPKPVGAIVTSPASLKTTTLNSKNSIATSNSDQLLQHTPQLVTVNNNNITTTTTPQLVNTPRVMQIICKSADGRLIPVTSLANRVLKVTAAAPSAAGTVDLQGLASAEATTTSSTLPKFNQVFGKTVYQTTANSSNTTIQTQPITIKGNVQNLQGFQGIQGLQSLQGGVIYTRQMPVGVGQTINIIGGTPQSRQVFRIAAANNATGEQHLSLVKDTVIHSKMSALLAAALQGQKATTGTTCGNNVVLVDHGHSTINTATGDQQQQTAAQASASGTNKIHIRPTTLVQNVSLSSTTLEQLREFDMVYKQVTERSSTSTPADLANESASTSTTDQPQQQATATTPTTATATVQLAAQPTQRISLAYVNNQGSLNKLNCAQLPLVVVSSYGSTPGIIAGNSANVCPTKLVTAKVTKVQAGTITSTPSTPGTTKSKPTPPSTPTLTQSPSQQSSSQSSPQASTSASTKTSPIQPKPAAKPQEDEHTTQRIFDILAEYAEQLRNSPDLNNKPAPRRRSNPPTNPTNGGSTSSSKRKKSSSGGAAQAGTSNKTSNKPSAAAQQSSSSSTDVDIDDGRTMGSEDSSGGCGQPATTTTVISETASQSICAASSVPLPAAHITVATTPQQSPPQTPKPTIVSTTHQSQQPHLIITDPTTNQTRNLIIADGTNSATAVLVPGNYLMPLTSMVKSGQQIAVVNAGGNKILAAMPAGRNIQHPANMLLFQSFLNQLPAQAQQRKTVVTTSCTTANSGTTTTVKYSLQPTPILTTGSTNELLLRIADRNPTRTLVQQPQQVDVDGDVLMDGTATVVTTAGGNGTAEAIVQTNALPPILPIATSVIQGQAVHARDFNALANKHSVGKVGTQSTTPSVVRGVLNSIGRVTSVVVHPGNHNSNQSATAVIIPATAQAHAQSTTVAQPPVVPCASSASAAVSVIESPQTSKEQTANVLLRNGGSCVGVTAAKRISHVQTIQQPIACSNLNATATSKPIPYYPSSSNLLKFRKLMTNAALKAEQQAPLQTLPLLQRRHAAAAAAVYERELRIQKSLSEECEDLGVDEPSASDLFPEAADLLVFDNNHSPTATSFDNLQIHHSTVSSTPDPHTVKHCITKQEKLTLFGDDDFLFDSDEYQTSNQSQMPQLPSYEEGNVAITTIVNGSDHTLLQTCASMSDVTMNSPISPEYPVDRYAVHKYSNRKKQQLSPAAVVSHSSTSTSTSGSSNSGEDTTSTEDPMDSMDDNSRFVVMVKRPGHVAKRCCGRRKMRNRSCSCCNGVSIHEEDMDEITTANTTLVEEEVITSPIAVLPVSLSSTTASTIATQQQVNSRKRSLPAMLAKRSTPLKKR